MKLEIFSGPVLGIFSLHYAARKHPSHPKKFYELSDDCIFLAGGKAAFEQHVVCASGHGSPAIKTSESEHKLQATFSSEGKMERCCEKAALTGPAKKL